MTENRNKTPYVRKFNTIYMMSVLENYYFQNEEIKTNMTSQLMTFPRSGPLFNRLFLNKDYDRSNLTTFTRLP